MDDTERAEVEAETIAKVVEWLQGEVNWHRNQMFRVGERHSYEVASEHQKISKYLEVLAQAIERGEWKA